jgi:hypothetical protein
MSYKITPAAALFAVLAVGVSLAEPVQAGTCQPVKAKGIARDLATATLYAQADLTQTAKSMKGKVTQAKTNCVPGPSKTRCVIDAVVCPK